MEASVEPALVWSAVHENWDEKDRPPQPALRVGIVLWPDFTLTALSCFIDALRLAADVGDRSQQLHCKWTVMSLDSHPVRASCGLSITPEAGLLDPRQFDYLVVASGLIRGIETAPATLESYLVGAADKSVPLIGLCTGGIVLARAGLMKGKLCCVASYHVADLERLASGTIPLYDRLFLDDGDRITCAGGIAAIDLASYLVQRHCGRDRAVKLVDNLHADRPRRGTHAQNRSWLDLTKIRNSRARRALVLMEQNLHRPLSIAELADRLNTSERQIERIFATAFGQSPSKVYRMLRLRFGEWLLTNTEQSVTQIAHECGFTDSSHFCRHFVETFGSTPTELRVQARSGDAQAAVRPFA